MLILKNSLSWMIGRLILFMYEKVVIIDRTSKCQHFTASQPALLHTTSEMALNFWTSAAVPSLLCCTKHQRSSWICGLIQLLLTICCVAHHVRDQPEFVDIFSCCLQSAVLHITSEIILNL